jgi:protein subunit release factor A
MKKIIQQQFPGVVTDTTTNAGGKPTEQQVQAMVQDMQKLMQAHQLTMQENQQMQQLIQGLQSALKSKDAELQVKADGQVIKAQAEIHKANVGLQQSLVEHDAHIKTAAITSMSQGTRQVPGQHGVIQQPDYNQGVTL